MRGAGDFARPSLYLTPSAARSGARDQKIAAYRGSAPISLSFCRELIELKHKHSNAAVNSSMIRRPIRRWFPLFMGPMVCAFIIGFVYPFCKGIYLSFCKFKVTSDAHFVGLENYRRAFQDASFVHSFWFTALFAVISLVLINVLAFAVAYAGILLREISARTYATELAYLVPGILFLFFAACSGIAGRLFLNRVSSSAGSFPSMLPVLFSAILLPLLLPLLSMTRRSITSAAVLLPLLALPLFFSGLNIHFILKLAAPARSPLLFAIHYLGAAFSGILFAVLVHSLGDTLLLLLLTGLFLVILSLILHLPLLKRMLPCILLLLTALLSSAALIHTACGYLEQRLAHADPLRGKDAIRIDTPHGRAELLRLPDKRFLITNNGQSIATLPINPEKDRLSALTTGIQPDKKRIRVLLICNEFSGLPEAFASMPITASIDVVVRDKELLDLSTGLDIMPPESSRFRVVIDDPVHFIDSTFHVYDVIFVEPPLPQNLDADRLFSYEFYKDAYRHLADGGVFATALPAPYGYTRESIAELHGITAATMRKVFPKVIFAPGTTQIAIGGGMNITSDLDTLDARAAGLMAETGFFPEGLLVILHSQVEQQAQTQKIIGRSIVSESNRLFSAPLLINYWRRHPVFTQVPPAEHILRGLDHCLFYRQWIIGGILLLYLLLRYFASTSVTRKCLFFSLENGFYLNQMLDGMNGHILAAASLCGVYFAD
mgnify:CR=1 FL=1